MNLSAKEIERAKFTFSIYDFDGSNVMDAFNLGDALRALGLNPTLSRIDKLGGTRRKREKTLQVEEFLAVYADAKKDKDIGGIEDFLEGLKCYDKKGEGNMSAAELHHVLLSYGEKLDPEESQMILKDCADSPDEDGLISYKSFLNRLVGNLPEKKPETRTEPVTTSTTVKEPEPEEVPVAVASTSSKPKKSKKATAESASVSKNPEDEATSSTSKSPKPRSASITAPTEPKPPPVEKKFQMPLISMKTDALFK